MQLRLMTSWSHHHRVPSCASRTTRRLGGPSSAAQCTGFHAPTFARASPPAAVRNAVLAAAAPRAGAGRAAVLCDVAQDSLYRVPTGEFFSHRFFFFDVDPPNLLKRTWLTPHHDARLRRLWASRWASAPLSPPPSRPPTPSSELRRARRSAARPPSRPASPCASWTVWAIPASAACPPPEGHKSASVASMNAPA